MPGFLIEYHRRRGAVKVEQFNSLAEAMEERLLRDQKNLDEDLAIVTEKSHSRYFFSA